MDEAASKAAIAMVLECMVQLSPWDYRPLVPVARWRPATTVSLGLSGTPAPHAGDVTLVFVEVYRHVAGFLIEPTTYEGGEQRRICRGHGEVIGAGHARG